ncbi:MAG: hypothetical protein H0X26_07910 [Alphaproteobacteria bacterium]|nr:hypothetical protein [Alphaproteobacteria bacterium]
MGGAHVVIRPRVFGPEAEDLIQEHLLTNYTGLYASQDYLTKFGVPEKPEDLDHHQLIAYGNHIEAEPYKAMNWHLIMGTEEGNRREAYIQVNSPQARFSMAKDGLGIICLSKEHPGLGESGLIQVLPHIPIPSVESFYIYSKELAKSKKVIALRDYMQKAFNRDFGKNNENMKIL